MATIRRLNRPASLPWEKQIMRFESRIEKFADGKELAKAAAHRFAAIIRAALAERGQAAVALAGGSTPTDTYREIAAGSSENPLAWDHVHIFWGDERCVPPDHSDSNYRMAREALLQRVPLPVANVHRIHGEAGPQLAADSYERKLRGFFSERKANFDLVFLGLGDDGHTASLFPSTAVVKLAAQGRLDRWAAASYVERLAAWRITLTPAVINNAAEIIFLVAGRGKAEVLKRVLHGPYNPEELPAQLIQPRCGPLIWMVDEAAARFLA